MRARRLAAVVIALACAPVLVRAQSAPAAQTMQTRTPSTLAAWQRAGHLLAIQRAALEPLANGAVRLAVITVRDSALARHALLVEVDRSDTWTDTAVVAREEIPGILAALDSIAAALTAHDSTTYVYRTRDGLRVLARASGGAYRFGVGAGGPVPGFRVVDAGDLATLREGLTDAYRRLPADAVGN